jgi:hypothetical protein
MDAHKMQILTVETLSSTCAAPPTLLYTLLAAVARHAARPHKVARCALEIVISIWCVQTFLA